VTYHKQILNVISYHHHHHHSIYFRQQGPHKQKKKHQNIKRHKATGTSTLTESRLR